MFSFIPNNTLSRADLNYAAGSIKNIHYGDVLIKFGAWIDVNSTNVPFINDDRITSRIEPSLLQNGDVIIADTAEDLTAGKATEVTGTNSTPTVAGLHTIACRPQRKFAPMFLGYYINSESFHNQLLPLIQGTKVSSISRDALLDTTIAVPSIDEQNTISTVLVSYDRKLERMEKNLKLLCNFKAGLLQSLFV